MNQSLAKIVRAASVEMSRVGFALQNVHVGEPTHYLVACRVVVRNTSAVNDKGLPSPKALASAKATAWQAGVTVSLGASAGLQVLLQECAAGM